MEIVIPDLPNKYTKSDAKLFEYISNHTDVIHFESRQWKYSKSKGAG